MSNVVGAIVITTLVFLTLSALASSIIFIQILWEEMCQLKLRIKAFLIARQHKRDRMYIVSQDYTDLLAEYQKREHDGRVDRVDIDKGAE